MSTIADIVKRDQSGPARRTFRVEPGGLRWRTELAEIWQFRELLAFLIWRDVKVRYRQTFLGVAWAILQPFLTMIVFTVVFGHLAGLKDPYKVPYALAVFTALLPWTYFASCLTSSSSSIVGSSSLVTKVFFPRILVPLGTVVVPIIDFFLSFAVLIGLFLWYQRIPHWHAVAIPFFLGMALLTAFGVGLWLSALNVRYRDVRYAVPFLTQIWLFASPVAWPLSAVPKEWWWLVALNPMTGVIDGFRWAVLGRGLPNYGVYLESGLVSVAVVVAGLYYFKRVERHFADVI